MNGAQRDATFVTVAGVMDVGVVRNGSRGKVEMKMRASKVKVQVRVQRASVEWMRTDYPGRGYAATRL